MLNKNRFFLILICFLFIMFIPWHVETILPAEIIANSQKISMDKILGSSSHKTLTTQDIHLNCCASALQGMEIFSGQDAIFFPESDQINPFHISIRKLQFTHGKTTISGAPLKINQYFKGSVKGLISIKGSRESLFMRAYKYLINS